MISVAIGVVLGAAFAIGGYRLQVLISKASSKFAPGLMVLSLMGRMLVLAAVVIPLAVYTDLNLLAILVAFAVVFTVLQVITLTLQVKRSKS